MNLSEIAELLKPMGFKRRGKRFYGPMLDGRAEMQITPYEQSYDRMTVEATLFVPLLHTENAIGVSPQAFRYLAPNDGPVYEDSEESWWGTGDQQRLPKLLPVAVQCAIDLFCDLDLMVKVYDYIGAETTQAPLPRFSLPENERKPLTAGDYWLRIGYLLLAGQFETAGEKIRNCPHKENASYEYRKEWQRLCAERSFVPEHTVS